MIPYHSMLCHTISHYTIVCCAIPNHTMVCTKTFSHYDPRHQALALIAQRLCSFPFIVFIIIIIIIIVLGFNNSRCWSMFMLTKEWNMGLFEKQPLWCQQQYDICGNCKNCWKLLEIPQSCREWPWKAVKCGNTCRHTHIEVPGWDAFLVNSVFVLPPYLYSCKHTDFSKHCISWQAGNTQGH